MCYLKFVFHTTACLPFKCSFTLLNLILQIARIYKSWKPAFIFELRSNYFQWLHFKTENKIKNTM